MWKRFEDEMPPMKDGWSERVFVGRKCYDDTELDVATVNKAGIVYTTKDVPSSEMILTGFTHWMAIPPIV
jgi:hypothetical protein